MNTTETTSGQDSTYNNSHQGPQNRPRGRGQRRQHFRKIAPNRDASDAPSDSAVEISGRPNLPEQQIKRGRGRESRGGHHRNAPTCENGCDPTFRDSPRNRGQFRFNPGAATFVPQTREIQRIPENSVPASAPRSGPLAVLFPTPDGPHGQRKSNRGTGKPQRGRPSHQVVRHRLSTTENSDGISLRDRLVRELERNSYECAICYQNISGKQGTWSCGKCYHIFHISHGCIVDWAKSSREDDNKWRCPTCQTKYEKIPYNYYCFCGKQRNPTYENGSTPHTCDGVCGKARHNSCPHPCTDRCHPGPCNNCPLQVIQSCNCGIVKKTIRCGSGVPVVCDNVCNKKLNCGNHVCSRVCHKGDCESCEEIITQVCFCGNLKREVPCGSDGGYGCGAKCLGVFSCGIHPCAQTCHKKDSEDCGICPLSVEQIKYCPCGRNSIEDLKAVRTKCTDPVPTCDSVCNKLLGCGLDAKPHRCLSKCHEGPCPACPHGTSVTCRCKTTKQIIPCAEYVNKYKSRTVPYLCEKRCRKRKSCGIHRCQEVCCDQEEHFCFQLCNKRLPCGLHYCESICHAGQCPRCLIASFDEQFCHCGSTMRPPPIACGSGLPECKELCARPHRCGHPIMHNCHGEVNCPPCTFLTEKFCYGKHEVRKNIPCHIEAVSCGKTCALPLPCGSHSCNRSCHYGCCENEGETCKRPCQVTRKICEHPCALPCHGTTPCVASACRTLVQVTCKCGRKKSSIPCIEAEVLLNQNTAEKSETEAAETDESERTLRRCNSITELNCTECDDACKKVARNKKLAEALNVQVDESGECVLLPTITYSDFLKTAMKLHSEFVIKFEKMVESMMCELNDPTKSKEFLTAHLSPMNLEKRRFIHLYAEYFNIETLSVDDPPKRSIILTLKRSHTRVPLILLSDLPNYKGAMSTPGPVTLRKEDGEEKPKIHEGADSEGMKTLKQDRVVVKRTPFEVKVRLRSPVRVKNTFSALRSDSDDEAGDSETEEKREENVKYIRKDWWDDPREENPTKEEDNMSRKGADDGGETSTKEEDEGRQTEEASEKEDNI